jgi:hypothetical protein
MMHTRVIDMKVARVVSSIDHDCEGSLFIGGWGGRHISIRASATFDGQFCFITHDPIEWLKGRSLLSLSVFSEKQRRGSGEYEYVTVTLADDRGAQWKLVAVADSSPDGEPYANVDTKGI